ncbi:hypothetical protein ACXR6G_18310 [Ancylomarina sp. YFZ004]
MTKGSNMYEISLSKLNKTSRKRLITAKKYIDRYVKKHCSSQFSEDMTQNKELIRLLYTSPFHTACRSNILKLGLEYYSGLLLISQIPVSFYWQYRFKKYRICYKSNELSGSSNPDAIRRWFVKGYDLDAGLNWYRNLHRRRHLHYEAVVRYRNLHKGEKPHWNLAKLYCGYPFKNDITSKKLDVIMKEEPGLSLMDYIKNSTFFTNQPSTFLHSVALYLNCETSTKIGSLNSEDICNALWKCYLRDESDYER